MSITEIDEVGSILDGLISDNATSIVGTHIDPCLISKELRVTLIITGINKAHAL